MRKLVKESLIQEGYGAGFSMSGGFRGGMGGTTRGGFGGAYNAGGPNSMYTYEVKPLNHSLEQPPTSKIDQIYSIKIGSRIAGSPVLSNAYPDGKKRVKGIVQQIVQTDNGAIKYYVIQDEATQTPIKVDPLTVSLIVFEPVRYYYNATDTNVSKRKQKIEAHLKEGQIVREHISL